MAIITGTANADVITPDDLTNGIVGGIPSDLADSISGAAGNDLIDGGGGNDTLTGDNDNDTLLGGDGNDILDTQFSCTGNDSLDGGAGNDTLFAFGADTIDGGADDDLIRVWNDQSYVLQGGTGIDTVSIMSSYWLAGTAFSSSQGIDIVEGNNLAIYAGAGFGAITNDNLDFSTLTLNAVSFIDGQGGNDTITGSSGDNAIRGGNDNDSLSGGFGADTLTGDGGNDTLQGGDGNDILDTQSSCTGSDSLAGGAGNDTLFAFGADTIDGGTDDDLIRVWNDQSYVLQGGTGIDTVSIMFSYWLAGTAFNSSQGIDIVEGNNLAIYAGASIGATTSDNLDFSTLTLNAVSFIDGQGGNDTITGSSGDNAIRGGNDNDSLSGGFGADTLTGDGGNDTLLGGDGNDILDTQSSCTGNDSLVGGAGNDTLFAFGADTLDGGSDNDLIQVWSDQAYVLRGGTGIDTLSIMSSYWLAGSAFSFAANRIENIQGNNLSIYAGTSFGAITNDVLNFSGIALTAVSFIDGQGGNDTISGIAVAAQIRGGLDNDSIVGGSLNDTIRGDGGNDTLVGGNGNDILDSDTSNAAGDDSLVGGIGNDSLFALGADTIRGDAGNDVIQVWSDRAYDLKGGANTDTVSIASSWWFIGTSFNQAGNEIEIIQANGQEIYGGSAFGALTADDLNFSSITVNGLDYIDGQGGNDTIQGLAAASRLYGGSDNDSIVGSTGNDTLRGDAGNDTLVGGDGNDILDSTPFSDAAGADSLVGGSGDDTLFASGADTIRGDAGNDLIRVWSDTVYDIQGGTDAISDTDTVSIANTSWLIGSSFSLAGNDIEIIQANGQEIYGSTTADNLNFAGIAVIGLDFIDGQAGNDTIQGLAGASRLYGGNDNDSIVGSTGNDTLRGDTGNDTLLGGNGNDILDTDSSNGGGADSLVGGIGDDSLFAVGADTIRGDAGNDFIQVWTDQAYDIQGGSEIDTVSIAGGYWFIGSTFSQAGNGIDIILANGQEIYGGSGFGATTSDNLNFTGITVTGLDFIDGQAGNDTILGLAGAAKLYGGSENDSIVGSTGNDTLRGDTGNDTLLGGNGNDIIDSDASNGAGADSLVGGIGNDSLFAIGADTIRGDAGNDFIQVWSDQSYDIQGGNDVDTVSIASAWWFIGSTFNFLDNGIEIIQANGQEIYGGSNFGATTTNDILDFTGISVLGLDFVDGQGGDDSIVGSLANDDLRGSEGNDTLRGGDGNDTLRGGNGIDVFDGGAGIDTLDCSFNGTGGSITLPSGISTIGGFSESFTSIENVIGSGASDSITGSLDDNVLYGGGGNDTILGGAGNDTIRGGSNANALNGEGGIDTADFSDMSVGSSGDINLTTQLAIIDGSINNTSTLVAFENAVGGAGNDTITGTAAANRLEGQGGNDSLLGDSGNDTLIGGLGADNLNGGALTDTVDYSYALGGTINLITGIADFGPADIDALSQIENVVGSQGRDTITGSAGANLLDGGRSNDSIVGEAGNDTLLGGLGTDTLVGGIGNDSLNGGTGNDRLVGGSENDTYVIDSIGDVVIEVLGEGTDTIQTTLAAYSLAGLEVENLLGTNAIAYVFTGNALNNVLTGNSAADQLNGSGGNDILNGGALNDTLTGGIGNDTYVVDNIGDVVVEAVGEGTDTIQTTLAAYTLVGLEVENLTGTNAIAHNFTGNALNNVLTGNGAADQLNGSTGNDTLIGGALNDTLTGGAGLDVFKFDAPNQGTDSILDFVSGSDEIHVRSSAFGGLALGTLAPGNFLLSGQALPDAAVFIYNGATGTLSFDSNGSAAGGSFTLATLAGLPALAATDIEIVAV